MARSLVICPTHDHTDTLFASIASLQAQRDADWRLVVICDGAPQRTLDILEAFSACDPRIEFVDHPKGQRFGEGYRDPVISNASEEVILHLGDDDIWQEDHLGHMRSLLLQADWAYSGELSYRRSGKFSWRFANLGAEKARLAAARDTFIDAGLNNVAYRTNAYAKLDRGWQPAPEGSASDVHMWRVFVKDPSIRIACSARPSFIKLAGRATRREMTPVERLSEMSAVLARINRPGFMQQSRQTADFTIKIFHMWRINECDREHCFEEALKQCGLQVSGSGTEFSQALDGEAMALPVTEVQRDQLLFTWLIWRALSGNICDIEELRKMLPRFRPFFGELLSNLARTNGDMFDAMATLAGDGLGMRGIELRARVRNALKICAYQQAEVLLLKAEKVGQNAKWVETFQQELAARMREHSNH